MDTEQLIKELRYLEEKYENCIYGILELDGITIKTNWYRLCRDVADRLEELSEELKALKS